MAASEWYNDWFSSPFYHKLYFERDEEEAKSFIQRLLQHLQPKPNIRMVDVASGRGRYSRLLAAEGYNVTGIDLSLESIQYAKQFEKENLHFYMHDMRLPFWINYFDYAFNFFTSFGYFRTRREHDDAVRTIVNSLRTEGIILFDYLNTHYAEDHLKQYEIKEIDETAYEIHRWHNETHFFKRIKITDPTLTNPLEFTEKVSKFSLGDFNDMLSFQKVQITEVFGDYHLNPYDVRRTPRMIVIGKKNR